MIEIKDIILSYKENYMQGQVHAKNGNYAEAKQYYGAAAKLARTIAERINDTSIKNRYIQDAIELENFVEKVSETHIPKNSTDDNDPRKWKVDKASLQKWDDIAGLTDVKRMLELKVLGPLTKPEICSIYKRKPAKTMQVILYGPPGTGKTMFAEAIADKLDMAMYRAKSSDIISPYLGESGVNLVNFLSSARNDRSERILIFIDEFDSIASKRSGDDNGSSRETSRLVNELLQGVDDLVKQNCDKMIIFMVTTNYPWRIDEALLRGKRFDTQIYVGLPDREARCFLIQKTFDKCPREQNISIGDLADLLRGYGAADIVSICEKIAEEPMMRHLEKSVFSKLDKSYRDFITQEDITKIVSNYPNRITDKLLLKYDKYLKGEAIED